MSGKLKMEDSVPLIIGASDTKKLIIFPGGENSSGSTTALYVICIKIIA